MLEFLIFLCQKVSLKHAFSYDNAPVSYTHLDVYKRQIPFDSLKTNIDHVFSVVDKNGKAVLLKDNKPVYIVLKYDENNLADTGIGMQEMPNYCLLYTSRCV